MPIKSIFCHTFSALVFISLILSFSGCSSQFQGTRPPAPDRKTDRFDPDTGKVLLEIDENIKRKDFDSALGKIESLIAGNKDLPKFHLIKARILRKKGETQKALDYLTEQIKNNPSNTGLLAARGQFLLDLRHIESARSDFYQAYRKDYRTFDILKILADISQESRNFIESLNLVKEALALKPENDQLWFQKAQLELRLFRISEAKLSSIKTLELNDNNIKYHQFYIEILSFLRQEDDVNRHVVKMHQKFPDNAWISMRYSALLVEKKEYEKAKNVLLISLKSHPEDHLLMFQVATILAAEKKLDESIKYFRAGLNQKPSSIWAKIQLAKIYLQTGEISLATEYLVQAKNGNASDLFVYETLAKIYLRQNDTYNAENVILQGLAIDAKNQNLILEYAGLLERRGKHKEAIMAYAEAYINNPNDYVVLGKLGNLYRLTKDYDKSLKYLEQAIEQNSNATWIRSYYVETLAKIEKWDEALDELERIIQMAPDDYWAYAKKALIEQTLKKYSNAHESILKAIALKNDAKWLKEIEAQILESMGKYEEAAFSYREALKQSPDSAYLLTRLGYVLVFIDKEKALQSVEAALDIEDFDISTIELYLYLTDDAVETWKFAPNSLEIKLYDKIVRKQFEETAPILAKIKRQSSSHSPFLEFFQEYLKKNKKAKLDLSQSEIRSIDSQWHYFYLGIDALRRGKEKVAKDYFQKGLELDPDNLWIMVKLAFVFQQLNEHQQSIELLKKFLDKRQGGDNIWAQLRLALNYDLTKQYTEAEKVYKTILSKKPGDNIALNNLAWMYLTTKDPKMHKVDEALELALKAVKISPSAANLDTLAEAYYQKKEYRRALKAIESALDQDRQSLDDFKKTKKKILKAIQSKNK
ncbi:MAG: tetratricopeptide repeat protein [Proteobacteria bacterium]|nr:tetratricopeptide repeat protein [Pseudomonadota bacterium]